ncbi:MAG TPA: hypothetical protein VK589_17640 [Chryseolinea sp.]|nr:hypothetical protein [Chryseolinea sp.]
MGLLDEVNNTEIEREGSVRALWNDIKTKRVASVRKILRGKSALVNKGVSPFLVSKF